jgi:hypothetical protein
VFLGWVLARMRGGVWVKRRQFSVSAAQHRVEPTDTERGRLRAVSESIGVVGEGVLVAPYRRLISGPLGGSKQI